MPRNNNKNRNRNRNNNQQSVVKNVAGGGVVAGGTEVEPEPSLVGQQCDETLNEAKDKLEQIQESVDRIKANLKQVKADNIEQKIADKPLSSTSNDDVRTDSNETASADAAKKKRNRNRNRKKNAAIDNDNGSDSHESSPTNKAASEELGEAQIGAGYQSIGNESTSEAFDTIEKLEAIIAKTIPTPVVQTPVSIVDDVIDAQVVTNERLLDKLAIFPEPQESAEEKPNVEVRQSDEIIVTEVESAGDKQQQSDKSYKIGKKAQKQNKKPQNKKAVEAKELLRETDLIESAKPEEDIAEKSEPIPAQREMLIDVEPIEAKSIEVIPIESRASPMEVQLIETKLIEEPITTDSKESKSDEAKPIEIKLVDAVTIEEAAPVLIESTKSESAVDDNTMNITMKQEMQSCLKAEKVSELSVPESIDSQVETIGPFTNPFDPIESKKQKNKKDKHKKANSEAQRKPLEEIAEDSEKISKNIKKDLEVSVVQSANELIDEYAEMEGAIKEILLNKQPESESSPNIEKLGKKMGFVENDEGTNTPTPSPVASQIIDSSKFIKKPTPQEDEAAKIWKILEEASKSLEPVEIQMDDGASFFEAKSESIEAPIEPMTPVVTIKKDEHEASKAAESLASILAATKALPTPKAGKTKESKKSPKMASKNDQDQSRKMAQVKGNETKKNKEPPKELVAHVAEIAPSPPPRKSSSPDKRASTIETVPLSFEEVASPVEKSVSLAEKSPSPIKEPSPPAMEENESLHEVRASSPVDRPPTEKSSSPAGKAPAKAAKALSATKASAQSKKTGEKAHTAVKKSPMPNEKRPSPPKRAEKALSPSTKATSKKSTTPPKQPSAPHAMAMAPLEKPPSPPEKSAPDEGLVATQIDDVPLDISILPNAIETENLEQIESKNVQGSGSVPSVEPSMTDAAESLGPENTMEETIVAEQKSKSPTAKSEKSDAKLMVASRKRTEATPNTRSGAAQPAIVRVKKPTTSIESNKKLVPEKTSTTTAAKETTAPTARRLSDDAKSNKTSVKQSTTVPTAKAPVMAKVNSKPTVPPKPDHLSRGTTKKPSATFKTTTAKSGAVDRKPVLATDSNSPYDSEEDYIEYKFVPRQVFISTICQSCKTPTKSEQRVFCPKCQMVAYCGAEHVLADELLHKELCGAVQEIAKKRGGHIYNNARILNDSDYRSLRVHTLNMCENLLKRPLQTFEREILLFPRLCTESSCREWRQNLLVDCPDCTQVFHCADYSEHKPEAHERWCKSLALYQQLVVRQSISGRIEPNLPSRVFTKPYVLPNNIADVFNDLYKSYNGLKDDCVFATLTQLATAPLTAYHATRMAETKIGEKFIIHLVGAELQFEADILDIWETFFLHLFPKLVELTIVFCGPELNAENIPLDIISRIRMCRSCRQSCRIVKFDFQCGKLYHDYAKSSAYSKPDLVCFFNPGFHHINNYDINGRDTWTDTIKIAASSNCPIVVTSYTEFEAPKDLCRFQSEMTADNTQMSIVLEPQLNPYASQRPERNFISDEIVPLIFKNYYCFVAK